MFQRLSFNFEVSNSIESIKVFHIDLYNKQLPFDKKDKDSKFVDSTFLLFTNIYAFFFRTDTLKKEKEEEICHSKIDSWNAPLSIENNKDSILPFYI